MVIQNSNQNSSQKAQHLISSFSCKEALSLAIGLLIVSLLVFCYPIQAAEDDDTADAVEETIDNTTVPMDLIKDRAIASQLRGSEAKWLTLGDTEFLGVFNENKTNHAFGSILILPAPGSTPLEQGVLPVLAKELPKKGWHSLSFTTPQLDFSGPSPKFPATKIMPKMDESSEETKPQAAEQPMKNGLSDPKVWFEKQQTKNMELILERLLMAEAELLRQGGQYVLIAQGASAELVLELISSKVIKPSGFISLNIRHTNSQRELQIPQNLAAVQMPILDLYNNSYMQEAEVRKLLQKNTKYRQIYIPGNGINFRGSEALLTRRVSGWLKNNFLGK